FKDLLEPINIEMKEQGQIVTHVDLLNFLKNRNELGYRKAIEQHFEVYKRFLNSRK
ncbi:FadR family transcriptional regulator, partial [Parabacteroides merdae]|nr:FadR family transcriptional regulator [Parabacteroides merdae]